MSNGREGRPAWPERIGVFGGTFDPVHVGHLSAAAHVRAVLGLDRMLLVVANRPWQKEGDRAVTPAEDRFQMVRLAVGGRHGLEASRIEIDRGGESYTADTLEELAASAGPGAELFLVVGADVAAELDTWERLDAVRRLATLVVVERPLHPGDARRPGAPSVPSALTLGEGWCVERVAVPAIDLSSSEVRRRVAAGLPLDFLVPDPVIAHIRRRGLYA